MCRTSSGLMKVVNVVVDLEKTVFSFDPSGMDRVVANISPGRIGIGQVDNAAHGPFGPVGGHYDSKGMEQDASRV
jgi:hypothetical protein